MKNLNVVFDDFEYQRLVGIKGTTRSWREFILQLAGIHKDAGDKK